MSISGVGLPNLAGAVTDIPAMRVFGADGKAVQAVVRPDITEVRLRCLQASVDAHGAALHNRLDDDQVASIIATAQEWVFWAVAPVSDDESAAATGS